MCDVNFNFCSDISLFAVTGRIISVLIKLLNCELYREAFRSRLETIVRGQANARSVEPDPRSQPVQERSRQDETAHRARPAHERMHQDEITQMAERPVQMTWSRPAVTPNQNIDLDTTVHDMELRDLIGRLVPLIYRISYRNTT